MASGDRQLYVTRDVKLVMGELTDASGLSASWLMKKMIGPRRFDRLLKSACRKKKLKLADVTNASRDKRKG